MNYESNYFYIFIEYLLNLFHNIIGIINSLSERLTERTVIKFHAINWLITEQEEKVMNKTSNVSMNAKLRRVGATTGAVGKQ
jgi:hypothetical protein